MPQGYAAAKVKARPSKHVNKTTAKSKKPARRLNYKKSATPSIAM